PHRAVSAQPVRSWWLQHAKLVAVWVGKDVPAPPRLADRPLRQDLGTNAEQSLLLRLKVARAQVEVNPVLAVLTLGNLLQKNLGALDSGQWQRRRGHTPAQRSRTLPSGPAGHSRS